MSRAAPASRPRAVEAVPLTTNQIHEAGDVLARAWADDPFWAWVLPNQATRTRQTLAAVGRGMVRYGLRHGEVYTTRLPLDGIAIWLPRPRRRWSASGLTEQVALTLALGLSPRGTLRYFRAIRLQGRATGQPNGADGWWLVTLAVSPSRRGQGIGSGLIAPVLARAEQAGASCVVSTPVARAVLFYVHHGFQAIGESDLPNGPRIWTLRRPANPD